MQLLGVRASKAEIAVMLEKAGADDASELDPEAFNRVMTQVLTKAAANPAAAAAMVRISMPEPLCEPVWCMSNQ